MFDILVILLGIILLAIIRVPIRKSDFDEPPKTRRPRRRSKRPQCERGGLRWMGNRKRQRRNAQNDYWNDYD